MVIKLQDTERSHTLDFANTLAELPTLFNLSAKVHCKTLLCMAILSQEIFRICKSRSPHQHMNLQRCKSILVAVPTYIVKWHGSIAFWWVAACKFKDRSHKWQLTQPRRATTWIHAVVVWKGVLRAGQSSVCLMSSRTWSPPMQL